MKVLKHFGRIVLAFFAAIFAALLVNLLLHPLITGSNTYSYYFSLSLKEFALVAGVDWLFLAMSAIVPALIAIAIAEAIKLRSVIAHLVVGAMIGFLFTGHARSVLPWIDLSGTGPAQGFADSFVMILAGAFGALAYWRYAGKYAGIWREA